MTNSRGMHTLLHAPFVPLNTSPSALSIYYMQATEHAPRVQEVHTKAEVVHLTPGLLGLGVLFNCHA